LGVIQVRAGLIEVIAGVRNGADGGYRGVRALLENGNIGRIAAMANRINSQALAIHSTKK
jgi:hypothetical protein